MVNCIVWDFVRYGFICFIINFFRSFKIIIIVKYKFDGNFFINVILFIFNFGKSVVYKFECLYFCKIWNFSICLIYKL